MTNHMDAVIYHNPRCGKSRQTLDLLRQHGMEPTIVEYLKTPADAQELADILGLLNMEPRQLMRKNEPVYRDLGLDDPGLSRAALIEAMTANPILIERPIVLANGKAALGRPPENVLSILK